MALGTYTQLQTSILSWLDRANDTALSAVVPDFIALFEANANTEGAIRTQFNRTSTALSTVASQNYVSTPSDYLGTDSLIITRSGSSGYDVAVPYGGAAALYTAYPSAAVATGQPKAFINMTGKLELAPVPDTVYTTTLYYYQKIPALATNSTNWLLTNFPQIYLFGSLVASEAFLGASNDISKWGSLYDNAIQKLEGATDRNKYGGSALSVKVDAVA